MTHFIYKFNLYETSTTFIHRLENEVSGDTTDPGVEPKRADFSTEPMATD